MSKRVVYADHCATTPLDPVALNAMLPFLRDEFGNPSSLHSWAKAPREAVKRARETIAECIGAKAEQIFFTSGGTESDNWVIKLFSSRCVSISAFEHHAVLNSWNRIERCEKSMVYPDANGIVDPGKYFIHTHVEPFERQVVGLASLMLANNEVGTIQPVKELVTKAIKSHHSRTIKIECVHTDAVQAVGNINIDVRDLGVDFLSASAHKFNGPHGIGFLYVKDPKNLKPYVDGGQQEFGMRAGTENVAAIVGMAMALQRNCDDMDKNCSVKARLVAQLKNRISNRFPEAVFNCEGSPQLPGFVSVSFPGRSAEGIMHILDLQGIAVSTGAACDSKNTQVSHVLKAIGLSDDFAKGTIRISLGKENAEADVEGIVDALKFAVASK